GRGRGAGGGPAARVRALPGAGPTTTAPRPALPGWLGPPVPGDPPLLRAGIPALDAFPYASWARLLAHHARHSLRAVAAYQDPAGYRPLRDAIAAHLAVARGVRCAAEQVIIVSGAQGAIDLVTRT